MIKVGMKDVVKQIIAINKELDDHDSRQDAHMIFIQKLQDRIEKLDQQAPSSKRQATSLPQSCGTAAGKQKGRKWK